LGSLGCSGRITGTLSSEISRLFFSRAEQRQKLTVGRAGRTKGWPRSNKSDSRSVENNGLPEDTHVLASVTRHRPEPWRHRTCGFVESGRSHPTPNAKAMPSAPHPRTTRTSAASGPPLLSQRYFASFRPEPPVRGKEECAFTRRPRCFAIASAWFRHWRRCAADRECCFPMNARVALATGLMGKVEAVMPQREMDTG
jgi:hypothetical protein